MKEQKKGTGALEDMAALVAKRRQMAMDFYKKYNPSKTERQINSELNGIDFTKPVEVIKIAKKLFKNG